MDKKYQFYACAALTVCSVLLTLLFGFDDGWKAGTTICCYCLIAAFGVLTGLSYYFWKSEEDKI